jgi:hypothetical protein
MAGQRFASSAVRLAGEAKRACVLNDDFDFWFSW